MAARRFLVPLVLVRVQVPQRTNRPSRVEQLHLTLPPSSSGPGRRPLTALTAVQIRSGVHTELLPATRSSGTRWREAGRDRSARLPLRRPGRSAPTPKRACHRDCWLLAGPGHPASPNRSGASSTLIGWVTLSGRLSGPAGCAKASLRYAEHRAGRRQGPRACRPPVRYRPVAGWIGR